MPHFQYRDPNFGVLTESKLSFSSKWLAVCWCCEPMGTVACSQALSLRQVVSAAKLSISQGCPGPLTVINKIKMCSAVPRSKKPQICFRWTRSSPLGMA